MLLAAPNPAMCRAVGESPIERQDGATNALETPRIERRISGLIDGMVYLSLRVSTRCQYGFEMNIEGVRFMVIGDERARD